jgi:4-hydroxy-3-methylbut-2-enyl diphosphate reductase
VIDRIKALGAVSVRKMDGIEETIKFPLPKGLKLDAQGHVLEVRDSQLHQLICVHEAFSFFFEHDHSLSN